MGGDPAEGESVPVRGVTGVRGGRRGRCGGSILCHCSYSRSGRGGRDGGGVGFHDGAPIITVARVLCLCTITIGRSNTVFCLCLGCVPKFVNRQNGG